jgi:hypothetical protein
MLLAHAGLFAQLLLHHYPHDARPLDQGPRLLARARQTPVPEGGALPKTKGTLTNGTLLLLKCLAAFCMLGNVTASEGTLWSPAPPPKMTNQQHIQQLDQAMLVGHRLGLGFGFGLGLGLGSELSSSVALSSLLAWPLLTLGIP